MIEFVESGISFKFEDNNCFRVEQDPLVTHSYPNSTQNNRACECITVIDGYHCFIEAKSSAPKGASGNVKDLQLGGNHIPANWEAYDNYRAYLRSIAKKFIDSYNILKALIEERHGQERKQQLCLAHKKLNHDKLKFILVINLGRETDVDKDSLSKLKDALTSELRPFLRTWNIPDTSIKVVLPEQAKRILKLPIE
jgi:hypothetical protein